MHGARPLTSMMLGNKAQLTGSEDRRRSSGRFAFYSWVTGRIYEDDNVITRLRAGARGLHNASSVTIRRVREGQGGQDGRQ